MNCINKLEETIPKLVQWNEIDFKAHEAKKANGTKSTS